MLTAMMYPNLIGRACTDKISGAHVTDTGGRRGRSEGSGRVVGETANDEVVAVAAVRVSLL